MNQEVEQMAEELSEELETNVETVGSPEEGEYSEIELEAMEKGWNPEGVEGKRSLSAEEFLDRQPLYDKMHKLEKRLKEQAKAVEAIQQHEKMVRERMHKDHLKELEKAKKEAYDEMDFEKADKISNEIVDAKVEYEKESSKVVTPTQTPEEIQSTLQEWAEKNTWYNTDKVMQRFALGEGNDYRALNPDATFEDVLSHIEKEVKKEFPEKFQNMSRQKPSSVEGSATGARRTPTVSKQKTIKDLPEEAVSVMKTLVRAGAFKSEQDYINDYFNQ